MNIYCIIFMCTFGANNTDTTELPARNNSLTNGPVGGRGSTTLVDVASMILPEKGEPVPHMGDIVMELPNQDNVPITNAAAASSSSSSGNSAVTRTASSGKSPTLSDILLPPAARNQVGTK